MQLKKYNYGKQIAAIEKLIFVAPTGPSSTGSHRQSVSNASAAAPSSYGRGGAAAATTATGPPQPQPQPQGPAAMAITIDVNSVAPTPVLTMEQNSPESSNLPSATASTVDEEGGGDVGGGGAGGAAGGVEAPAGKEAGGMVPEVKIESAEAEGERE